MYLRNIKVFFPFLLLLLSLAASAQQVQYGYVKTRGKIGSDGQLIHGRGVPGVVIIVEGDSVVSDREGKFSFNVPKGSFFLSGIIKPEYSLLDNRIIRTKQNYSPSPLVILVEENSVITQEHVRISKLLRDNLQQELHRKAEELTKLLKEQKVTGYQYQNRLRALYAENTNYEKQVNEIIDSYLSINPGSMDDDDALFIRSVDAGDFQGANGISLQKRSVKIESARLRELLGSDIYGSLSILGAQVKDYVDLTHKADAYCQENKLDSALICMSERIELFKEDYYAYLDKACLLRDKFPNRGDEATSLYERAISYAKDNRSKAFVNTEYGTHLQILGDFEMAIERYSKALYYNDSTDPVTTSNLYSKMGMAYNSMRQYDMALECYQKAIASIDSTQIDYLLRGAALYNNIGVTYENQGKFGRALDSHYKALDIRQSVYANYPTHPDLGMSYSNIASVYDNIEAWEQAIKYYKKAIELYESNKGSADLALAYNNLATTYYNADSLLLAFRFSAQAFAEIQNFYSDDPKFTSFIQDNLNEIDAEIQRRIDTWNNNQVKEYAKENRRAALLFADTYQQEKYFRSALTCYERLYLLDPNVYRVDFADAQFELGLCLGARGREDDDICEKYLKSAEQIYKESPEPYRSRLATVQEHLAIFYMGHQNYEESSTYINLSTLNYEKLYDEQPDKYRQILANKYADSVVLYAMIGDMSQSDRCLDDALKLYEELYELQPNDDNHSVVKRLQSQKVGRLLKFDYFDEAMVLAERMLAMDESDENPKSIVASTYHLIAYEYANKIDFTVAHQYIDKAIALLPDNANFYDSKGEIFLLQGRNDEALEMWRKVLELKPNFLDDYPDGTELSYGLKKLGLIE